MDAAEAIYQAVMDSYAKGRREAIQECHEAVAALTYPEVHNVIGRDDALAAIDALTPKEETP